jgi:tRNA(fMet)-specific endonuclease VapC
LDSNVVILALRIDPGALAWLAALASRPLLPLPVLAELRFGAARSANADRQLQSLQRFVDNAEVVPLDTAVAEIQADLRLRIERAGKPIPVNDLWIAACCVRHELRLATRDAHLLELPGLDAFKPF